MDAFAAPIRSSKKIAILAGGDSDERTISLESGKAVQAALNKQGYDVETIDPAVVPLEHVAWDLFDLAFLALHGKNGEDGTVQSLLDAKGVLYTGSNAAVSRLAFSKSASKERFAQANVSTPPYVLIHASDQPARIQQQAERIGFPLVIKPDAQGSSLGVTIVDSPDELPKALECCFLYDSFGLIERAIVGTEWTVGLIDDEPLPPILIETARPFFDYQAKYEDDRTIYRFDDAAPPDVLKAIEATGREAAKALGTHGIARVDLRLDEAQKPWVLEVNTIPGFTDHSLIPKAAARVGIEFPQLCRRIVENGFAATTSQPHH